MSESMVPLPTMPTGFRFNPTDLELVLHHLRRRVAGLPCPVPIITDVDIYKHDPWELPSMACFGDWEWYFFTPIKRKYPNGIRPNRSASSGFWKATGVGKPIHDDMRFPPIAVKKTLVFYIGRPPTGLKIPWIMHEYRLADPMQHITGIGASSSSSASSYTFSSSMRLDGWALCRIFSKRSTPSPRSSSSSTDIQVLEGSPSALMYAPLANTYQSMLPSIQEEDANDNPPLCHQECQQNFIMGAEAITGVNGSEGESTFVVDAMANSLASTHNTNAIDHKQGENNFGISDQEINGMLMFQDFFDNQQNQE